MRPAVITIGIDPDIHLGPITIAWHGLTIAIGVVVGALYAGRRARRSGLDPEPLYGMAGLVLVGGMVGGKLFYLAEHGGGIFASRGYTFDGGVILAALLLAGYVWRRGLTARYLDVVAVGLPLGVAIGRIGDVINGEHFGPQSDFFLAVRNSNPHALTPNPALAYQNGGLYEVLLGLLVFGAVLVAARRVRPPGDLVWLVLGLFAVGRFLEFFARSDSPSLALGLNNAQWTSLALLAAVLLGRRFTRRHGIRGGEVTAPR